MFASRCARVAQPLLRGSIGSRAAPGAHAGRNALSSRGVATSTTPAADVFSRSSTFYKVAAAAGASAVAYWFRGNAASSEEELTSLSKKEFREFAVLETEMVSPDACHVKFALPSPEHTFGTVCASLVTLSAEIDGQTVNRPYTPISKGDQKGYVEFVVKAYPARTDGKPGGMGQHICSLKPGDKVQMKGPWKKFGYEANKWKHLGMIAGGTGLAPMYQLILESLNTAGDDTKITLLYANKSGADILLKERLDKLAAQHPSRFNVVYSLDTPPPGWKGEKGFVTADMVKEHMPAPVDGTRIFVCGPPPMVNHISGGKAPDKKQGELKGVLLACGYTAENVFKY